MTISPLGGQLRAGAPRGHLLALDGLRGVAILLVLAFHFTIRLGEKTVASGVASPLLIDSAYFRFMRTG